ncbi:hypothetical protein BUALT_Bualt05G0096000 [Buddleja alternifolia]|uniref:non-specific serine/threonine protein kinase n=1 Tax=Buddleja alternifolia TaxID=168488 RepID=A0AAV6XHW2_9LAMI|nr:hypothetical protein BUALT_Bualt05G0096000 [Buddleja alternifolia]
MAGESSAGFHHQRSILLKSSGAMSNGGGVSELIPMGNYYSNSAGSVNLSVNERPEGGMIFSSGGAVNSSNSPSTVPGLKHDTGLAAEWSIEEQYKLEEGLANHGINVSDIANPVYLGLKDHPLSMLFNWIAMIVNLSLLSTIIVAFVYQPFDLIHSDVWGMAPVTSHANYKYCNEPSILRYIKIAGTLRDKTVRDVALRCRWMTRKRRKQEDQSLGKKVKDRKLVVSICCETIKGRKGPGKMKFGDKSSFLVLSITKSESPYNEKYYGNLFCRDTKSRSHMEKMVDSCLKNNTSSASSVNMAPYSLTKNHHDQSDSMLSGVLSGTARHLLEENNQAFGQISANLSILKLQQNIDLFSRTRNNLTTILNNMKNMPGIMSRMPPLPVLLNEELASSIFPCSSQNLTCNPNDLISLRTFVEHLESGFGGWDFNSSSPDCCNWVGITCNSSSSLGLNESIDFGRVVKLELGRRRLVGNISQSLGNLEELRTLNLSYNSLKGSIPQSLLHLPSLEILDLSNNEISGLFPSSIDLPSIRVVNISENLISGQVPVEMCRNSANILVLNIADNNFSGNLPLGLGSCTSLEELDLATNFISGGLPEDIFQLHNLKKLALQENRFSGRLSGVIGNLSNLHHVDLSLNDFSGNLPDVFDRFSRLRYFSAQSNNFSGDIPRTLANSPTINSLSLRNNSLSGTIDLNCSAMVSLVSLNLATNRFHGVIPENLPTCPRLRTLNFARNNLTGQVPESFRNFHSLSYISLSNSSVSNLNVALGILQHCRNLTTLVLTLNFRDEEMSSNPSLQFTGLKTLVIANCRLTGHIPQWLNGCRKLQLLDLSWNRLEGSIPSWFGNLSSLFYLDLSNNSFTGEIPRELTGLQSLINGNISLEEPTPDFPFFVRRNLSGFKYVRVLSFPPSLELSNNFLTGPVWPEFGNLRELHVLDLKCNNLSGSIPNTLSGMTSLETLDLSFNNLNGTIPSSLVNLSFLSRFSVAHNALLGAIPAGGQFPTFSNSSFEGNPELCGDHGPRPCHRATQVPHLSPRKSKTRRSAIIAMFVGIGIGTMVLVAITYLIILWACPRKVVGKEADDVPEKDLEELSNLVILCQNKENNKEIFLDDLLNTTDNFDQSNIIGCGGFGLVYRAILSDGRNVAIKRLSGEYFQMEREFQAEIETLSRAQHPNLVHLQGYCKYKNDRLLIYTYMENGSLDYWLHEKIDGPSSLDWETRLNIARGAARGLAYLHLSCEPHILHRDIKSSNILLNEKFEAHLADFGLARLILPYDTHVSTDLVGTLGYIPPEYGQASVATYKGDIYSFGVVLLELLTGKRPMDMCRPRGCRDLISWVNQMRTEKRETEVFDPFIYDKQHADEMLKILGISCLCLNENPRVRPCAQQLVSWLDNIGSKSI